MILNKKLKYCYYLVITMTNMMKFLRNFTLASLVALSPCVSISSNYHEHYGRDSNVDYYREPVYNYNSRQNEPRFRHAEVLPKFR